MTSQTSPWVQRHARLLAALALVIALLAVAHFSGLRSQFTLEYLRAQLSAHPTSGIALFVLLFVLANLTHLPGWIFLAAAVVAFGGVAGGLVTYLAATTSCIVTFLTVRLVGGDMTHSITNRFVLRVLKRLKTHPVQSVALLRTVFQTLPTLNMALAVSGIAFKKYLIGTLVGLPLPIAVYCVFFDVLFKVTAG